MSSRSTSGRTDCGISVLPSDVRIIQSSGLETRGVATETQDDAAQRAVDENVAEETCLDSLAMAELDGPLGQRRPVPIIDSVAAVAPSAEGWSVLIGRCAKS